MCGAVVSILSKSWCHDLMEAPPMRRLAALISSAVLAAIPASAQQVPVKDVQSVLEAWLKAMGGTNLKTIQYTAHGWNSRIGQTYTLAE
jgi:hypothetical protein